MCSVGVRWTPDEPTWLTILAIREEITTRAFDDPGPYWPPLVGGRDQLAGGTWLAVDPQAPAVATLVNAGPPDGPPHPQARSRGELPVADLTGGDIADDLAVYGKFHLVHIDREAFTVRSHIRGVSTEVSLEPGVHSITPPGVDQSSPIAEELRDRVRDAPDLDALADWLGEQPIDIPPDPGTRQSLLFDWAIPEGGELHFASVCAQLIQFGEDGIRFDFTRTPTDRGSWQRVL